MGQISLREARRRGESVGGRFVWRGGDEGRCMFREASSSILEDRLPPQSHLSPIKPSHLHLHSPCAAIPRTHANRISSADKQYIKRRVRGDVELLLKPRGHSYGRGNGREGGGGGRCRRGLDVRRMSSNLADALSRKIISA
jgi:hypothetical protein